MLYIVATPIGNLGDITMRALETLRTVDLIVAEDTRHTQKLLKHFEVSKPLESWHAKSGETKLEKIIAKLEAGEDVALVSDAGTPGICDPGFKLVQGALAAGVEVVPIPGVTALATALSVSGMPMHNFLFLGFLPVKKGRQTLFKKLVEIEYTVVFYESVHRIEKTLRQLQEMGMGSRQICLGRELTKQFETFYRGTVDEVLEQGVATKGEFTCVLGPAGFLC